MGKGLHKLFKDVVNELKNPFSTLRESGSAVSHFIPEPRKFVEVIILPAEAKNAWLKTTLKDLINLINNQKFLMKDPRKE